MKVKQVIGILLLSFAIISIAQCQYLDSSSYKLYSGPNESPDLWVVQFDEDELKLDTRSKRQAFVDNLLRNKKYPIVFNLDSDTSKEVQDPTPVFNAMTFRRGQLWLINNQKESVEKPYYIRYGIADPEFKEKVVIGDLWDGEQPDTSAAAKQPITKYKLEDKNKYNRILIRAQWVSDIEFQAIFFRFYKWGKILILLIQGFRILVRPALPTKYKLKMAWVASSLFSIQIFYQLVYMSGNLGGAADEVNRGIMRGYRWYLGSSLTSFTLSPSFVLRASALFTNKYIRDIYLPNIFLQEMPALLLVCFGIIFHWFAASLENRRLIRLARETKTGIVLSVFVQLVTVCFSGIGNILYLQYFTTFSLATIGVSIFMLCYLYTEANSFTFVVTPKGSKSKYVSAFFNQEVNIVSFDINSEMKSKVLVPLRNAEFYLISVFPACQYGLSSYGIFSVIFPLVFFLVLSCTTTYAMFESCKGAKDLLLVNFLKLMDCFLKLLRVLLVLFVWIVDDLELSQVKVYTWITISLIVADSILIVFTLFLRFFFVLWEEKTVENKKRYNRLQEAKTKKDMLKLMAGTKKSM